MPTTRNSAIVRKGDDLLWKTQIYADMKIICDGKHWLVHRNILASRCAWFNDRIWTLSKVRTARETDYRTQRLTKVIATQKGQYYELELEGYYHLLVRAFLYFIYTGVLDHEHLNNTSTPDNVVIAQLHRMSGDFDLWELKEALVAMCSKALDARLECYAQNPEKTIVVNGILDGVKYAYTRPEHQQADLRAVYVNFFARCLKRIGDSTTFYERIRDIPAFSADLLEVIGKKSWGDEGDNDNESEGDARAQRHSRKKSGKKHRSHKHKSHSKK
ncbi:uncharacterized protein PG986_004191 [Apiospora aurea]|uniref:BTB domain-containing protein n=1 Tax=Apiospora aurea TaxID=335848 RepID=A0ABR1QMC6_9PEZI